VIFVCGLYSKFRCFSDRASQYNLSKNQLDAQYLCFTIGLLRLLHPSTCSDIVRQVGFYKGYIVQIRLLVSVVWLDYENYD
jgi:hypothetical protein